MKNIIQLIVFLLFLFSFNVIAQKQECSFNYRYGIPESKIKYPNIGRFSRLDHLFINAQKDLGVKLNY